MSKTDTLDRNADPITGESGSHPVGTGVGAAGGAAAGVVAGAAVGGPAGAIVGAAIGAVAGGAAGHGVGEMVNPTVESAYWEGEYRNRPYYRDDRPYAQVQDAYRYGWESRSRYGTKSWNEVESDLGRNWEKAKGKSSLAWEQAKDATRDAWHRVERAIPGDADNDGR
ncbi:MAG: hypothetical protein KBI44_20505 [Thermoanaerobaculia bacterium]|nr:hypothetical protein [Thermoanaerobaculia bacterium]